MCIPVGVGVGVSRGDDWGFVLLRSGNDDGLKTLVLSFLSFFVSLSLPSVILSTSYPHCGPAHISLPIHVCQPLSGQIRIVPVEIHMTTLFITRLTFSLS